MDKYEKLKKDSRFNERLIKVLMFLLKKPVIARTQAHITPYKPKHDTFLLIANHTDPIDPGYEMMALGRYIRYIVSDHLTRTPIGYLTMKKMGGSIIKFRNHPGDELNREVLDNLKAGIPVGIHVEGATSINGTTGFFSENTGKLVKDSGVALITFRFIGGYLRSPRWSNLARTGPLFCSVVNEYSPEEIAKMTVEEVNETIRRDIYVNVYEEQKKNPHKYVGKNLAQYCERVLYMCPKCKKIGTIHSHGDDITCSECGYSVRMGTDGFFHNTGTGLIYDNIYDWDMAQRDEWKNQLLSANDDELIFTEDKQIIYSVDGNNREKLTDDARLSLYKDRLEIEYNGKKETLLLTELKSAQIASYEGLILISDSIYYDIRTQVPRAAAKYVAAWRYLTGREYK